MIKRIFRVQNRIPTPDMFVTNTALQANYNARDINKITTRHRNFKRKNQFVTINSILEFNVSNLFQFADC